jgi:nicotinamide-nucleotide amidase
MMIREKPLSSRLIALLATGDEICNGDILNSNSQEIAQRLFSHGMQVGTHLTVADNLADLETAMNFLLQNHQALITIGGLGPTSDDLTRQALSHVLQRPLVFDEPTWQSIVKRLDRFGIHTPPENNRQQALFPKDAVIIPNPNGTAAGCMVQEAEKFIFMLPGPPAECLPMFDNAVLSILKNNQFQQIPYYKKWLLFNISEAEIAEKLDTLAEPFECTTGYRFCYPYIECKLYSTNAKDFTALVPLIEKIIAPYIIGDAQQTASDLLKKKIPTLHFPVIISDIATGGLLESLLRIPETNSHINFSYQSHPAPEALQIKITGLEEFWQQKTDPTHTKLEIHLVQHHQSTENKIDLSFRGPRIKQYAVELICKHILEYLLKE